MNSGAEPSRATSDARSRGRRRIIAAVLLVVTVALGLATHVLMPDGAASDIAGDALYTVAMYLGVMMLVPRARPWALAAVAVAWSFGIEFLQLTDVPARAADAFAPTRLVLGSGFDSRDLLVYALAGGLALSVDLAVGSLRSGAFGPDGPRALDEPRPR